MTEIGTNVDIPEGLEEKFRLTLEIFTKKLADEIELARAKEIVSKFKFTEKDAEELSERVKKSMLESL